MAESCSYSLDRLRTRSYEDVAEIIDVLYEADERLYNLLPSRKGRS